MQGWITKLIETAGGTSGLLCPPCISTPAVFLPIGDVRMYKSLFEHKLCKCGCGEEVKPGCNFVQWHHLRVPTEETKKKIRKALQGRVSPMLGKHHSKKARQKMSNALKGRTFSEETRAKLSLANKGHVPWIKGKSLSEKIKRKISEAKKRDWKNLKYRKSTFRGINERPTKLEKILLHILSDLFPHEYKYVGDKKTWIGRCNPDFINVNGQKKIIELFGAYWHGKEKTGMSKKENERQRQSYFAKYDYQTLVVWEHQLRDIPKLKYTLQQFHDK